MMKSPIVGFAVALFAAAALLEGCGAERAATMLPAQSEAAKQPLAGNGNYKLLYSFKGGRDGMWPESDLTELGGKLYGTTYYGGDLSCLPGVGCGTLYAITPSGAHKIVHDFTNYPKDGGYPQAGVIAVNGKLYGTTYSGGTMGLYGVVYESDTSGQEKVLHNFGGTHDGAQPTADLIEHNGVLFGTTRSGGNPHCYGNTPCGTVFSTTLSGHEKVVYAFRGNHAPDDGGIPYAGLIAFNGMFYGTNRYNDVQAGTVYSVSPSGKEHVLHSFTGHRDGAWPFGSLTVLNGKLYGTTVAGGAYGLGTVFAISPSGKLKTIYTFKGSPNDGAFPGSNVIAVNGQLYGTTFGGGTHSCSGSGQGCGTVFAVSPSGKEKVLYSFAGGKDGEIPSAGLLNVGGTLYGTTQYGGTGKCPAYTGTPAGCGTIFTIAP